MDETFQNVFLKLFTICKDFAVKKCPSSIRCWDSNPWPSGHESPPITTGPELPPSLFTLHHELPNALRTVKNKCNISLNYHVPPNWASFGCIDRNRNRIVSFACLKFAFVGVNEKPGVLGQVVWSQFRRESLRWEYKNIFCDIWLLHLKTTQLQKDFVALT